AARRPAARIFSISSGVLMVMAIGIVSPIRRLPRGHLARGLPGRYNPPVPRPDPGQEPPTTGATVEYTPDATARPGVSSAAGPPGPATRDSEAEAPGRPNPGTHRPHRAGKPPLPFRRP